MTLAGAWKKVGSPDCAQQYPDEIDFSEATFLAQKGPGQGFVIWDAGGYRVASEDEVVIQIATDEQVPYRYAIADDVVTFVDRDGCEFQYRRAD